MFKDIGKKHSTDKGGASFDFRLIFAYNICMIVLLASGEHVSLNLQINVVGILASVIVLSLIVHRRRNNWHWPGVGRKDILRAIGILALGLFFLGPFASIPSRRSPVLFPWLAAGGGIILYNVFESLKLVYGSRAKFIKDCGERPPWQPATIETSPARPTWKKKVKTAFTIYFIAVWIASVSCIWVAGWADRIASKEPTSEKTELLSKKGRPLYVTPPQKLVATFLMWAMIIGIPSVVILGIPVHFITREDPQPDETIDDE